MTQAWKRTGQLWARTVRVPETMPLQPYDGFRVGLGWTQLVAWEGDPDGRPDPIVLCVEAVGPGGQFLEGQPPLPLNTVVRASPPPFNQTAFPAGQLLVEYSTWGRVSRRWIDPRSGSYQLPPCHSVSVSAQAYAPDGEVGPGALVPYSLGVSVAPGRTSAPSQATYSGVFAYEGGGPETVLFPAPPGTAGYRVGWLSEEADATARVTGTQPAIEVGPASPSDYAPAVADLAPAGLVPQIEFSGADAGDFLVECLVGF